MAFEDIHRPLGRAGFKGAIRAIILISGAILIVQQFYGGPMIEWFGLTPGLLLRRHWLWQPFTYLFLHGGLFHWLFNMFILWMFGRELEVRWGTPRFVWYYFLTGLGAALCTVLVSPHSMVPTIGSSGSIFGILVAFAMVFPDAVLYLYFVIPVKAWQAAAIFGLIEIFAAMGGGGEGIARLAHLGGMATGYLYLRFSDRLSLPFRSFTGSMGSLWKRRPRASKSERIELHEVTDDLAQRVDQILEKILKHGVESLTPEEKELMDRYSRNKK